MRFFRADAMMLLACRNTPFSAGRHASRKEGCRLLTYPLTNENPRPLYEQLSDALRQDILAGRLPAGSRLPSKRSLSENLGVSSITVESAYNRLIDEGFVTSEPKRGYYVAELAFRPVPAEHGGAAGVSRPAQTAVNDELPSPLLDLSGNRAQEERFPFTVWARLLRSTINDLGSELLLPSPCGGVRPLREAIAGHLQSFRGMRVDPECVIVGAGTEYLYGLLIQLLGRDRVYCLEDPGYRKAAQIYRANGAVCRWAPLDDGGMTVAGLEAAGADVAHISPTHHFPTGITMPVGRRYELLAWAAAEDGRYIIEDDYDSEFRLTG
ncbi:MAG: PLP-dependent aminotransferase family protein, partial [Oscillospiraceae bacterium]|nr:PLP-dependent aminotransferase family protein [Oscillospiraceae bacterium]